ncbi:hypothetical protein ACMFMG_011004 [Clarireedia jacksonii]
MSHHYYPPVYIPTYPVAVGIPVYCTTTPIIYTTTATSIVQPISRGFNPIRGSDPGNPPLSTGTGGPKATGYLCGSSYSYPVVPRVENRKTTSADASAVPMNEFAGKGGSSKEKEGSGKGDKSKREKSSDSKGKKEHDHGESKDNGAEKNVSFQKDNEVENGSDHGSTTTSMAVHNNGLCHPGDILKDYAARSKNSG